MKARLNLVQLEALADDARAAMNGSGSDPTEVVVEIEVIPLHQVVRVMDEVGINITEVKSYAYMGDRVHMGGGIPDYKE